VVAALDSEERASGAYRFLIVSAGGATRNGTDTTRIRVSDIIVGGHGYGYLREVQSISEEEDIVTLQKTQAALGDVVLNGGFLQAFQVNDPDGSTAGTLSVRPAVFTPAPGVMLPADLTGAIPLDGVDFDNTEICYNPSSGSTARFEVGFEVTDGDLTFRPDIEIGPIWVAEAPGVPCHGERDSQPRRRCRVPPSLKAGYSLPDSVRAPGESEQFSNRELYQASTSFSFLIGYLPVFGRIIFNVSLEGEAKAGIEATWTSGVHIEYGYGISGGLKWDGSGWSDAAPPVPPPSYREDPFVFDAVKGVGEIRVSIVPQLNLEMYGVIGPFVDGDPYAKVAGDVNILTGDASAQLFAGRRPECGLPAARLARRHDVDVAIEYERTTGAATEKADDAEGVVMVDLCAVGGVRPQPCEVDLPPVHAHVEVRHPLRHELLRRRFAAALAAERDQVGEAFEQRGDVDRFEDASLDFGHDAAPPDDGCARATRWSACSRSAMRSGAFSMPTA
jgi:hypothetical protein